MRPVIGLRLFIASPANSTPRSGRWNETCPSVWPGVGIATGWPGTSMTSRSPNVVTSAIFDGKPLWAMCAIRPQAAPCRK